MIVCTDRRSSEDGSSECAATLVRPDSPGSSTPSTVMLSDSSITDYSDTEHATHHSAMDRSATEQTLLKSLSLSELSRFQTQRGRSRQETELNHSLRYSNFTLHSATHAELLPRAAGAMLCGNAAGLWRLGVAYLLLPSLCEPCGWEVISLAPIKEQLECPPSSMAVLRPTCDECNQRSRALRNKTRRRADLPSVRPTILKKKRTARTLAELRQMLSMAGPACSVISDRSQPNSLQLPSC